MEKFLLTVEIEYEISESTMEDLYGTTDVHQVAIAEQKALQTGVFDLDDLDLNDVVYRVTHVP